MATTVNSVAGDLTGKDATGRKATAEKTALNTLKVVLEQVAKVLPEPGGLGLGWQASYARKVLQPPPMRT